MALASTQRGQDKGAEEPRVRVVYEAGGGLQWELPFVVGVLADLSGTRSEPLAKLWERKFVEIARDNFNAVLRRSCPRFRALVPSELTRDCAEIRIDLQFGGDEGLEQFSPAAVAGQIKPLRRLVEIRQQLASLRARMDGNDTLKEWLERLLRDTDLTAAIACEARRLFPNDDDAANVESDERVDSTERTAVPESYRLDQVIHESRIGWDDWERQSARKEIATVVEGLVTGDIRVFEDSEHTILFRIQEIDSLLSNQLNEVLLHPDFQKLEATWRGLHYLVNQSDPSQRIRFRVMNVSKRELLVDMETAPELAMSALFRKVYTDEYDTFGGTPYAVLVGDYFFDHSRTDIDFLDRLSQLCEGTHLIFIAGADPRLFALKDYSELASPRSLARIFETSEYARWHEWRNTPAARYVGLVLPRMLLREPYVPDAMPAGTFDLTENLGENHGKYLWGNAAYVFAGTLTRAFEHDGWCAAIQGYETGGLVSGLTKHIVQSDAGDTITIGPTETTIGVSRWKELSELGFIALCREKDTDRAVFFSVPSCARPTLYDSPQATTLARLGTRLEYVLVTARFAHYFKVMARDGRWSFPSAVECQRLFMEWIAQYVGLDASPTEESAARRPLSFANVEVTDIPGMPGHYRIHAYLRPRFRLREPSEPLELTVEIHGIT